jgi:hypothetical protein
MFLHDEKKDKVSEILTKTGLDFTINKVPMLAKYGDGTINTPYFALINNKTDEVINSVKGSYHVTQNKDIVQMIVDGTSRFGDQLSISMGGSLGGGKKIFLQLAIEGNAKVGKDTIKRYVTIIDSNDGSTGLSVGIGDFTMSCSNQFFQFHKAGQSRFRHTASIEKRVLEIPTLIENALAQSMALIEKYNQFVSTECSRNLAHKLVNELLGFDKASMTKLEYAELSTKSENNMDKLYTHIEKEFNCKGVNLWGLHSGVTSWTTHEKQAPNRENGRIEGLMIGTNYRVNQKSMEFVTNELVTA